MKTKLDFVVKAHKLLEQAHAETLAASADLGTPQEIEDAEVLIRLASARLAQLLKRPLNR